MAKLYNLARMTTATTGTGSITLGAAVSGYLTFAQAGVVNGDVVDYAIKDGNNSEIGTGTYSASGTTLTRSVTKSTNGNAALNLSGTAEVFITVRAETLADASMLTAGTLDPARIGNGSLMQSKVTLGTPTNPGPTNLNSNQTTGFYAGTGYLNSPDGASTTSNYWYLVVQSWDNTHTQQMAMPLSPSTNDVYVRTLFGASWSAWERLTKEIENTRVLLGTYIANNTSGLLGDATIFQNSAYNDYEFVFNNVVPSVNGALFGLRYWQGGTTIQTGYIATYGSFSNGNAGAGIGSTYIPASHQTTNGPPSTIGGASGKFTIVNPIGNTAKHAYGEYLHVSSSVSTASMIGISGAVVNNTSPMQGISLVAASGNLVSGTVKIYGLR